MPYILKCSRQICRQLRLMHFRPVNGLKCIKHLHKTPANHNCTWFPLQCHSKFLKYYFCSAENVAVIGCRLRPQWPPQAAKPAANNSETNEDHVKDSRSIFVTPVEHHEGVRLAKEVLLVQLVGAELQGGTVLRGAQRRLRNLVTQQWSHPHVAKGHNDRRGGSGI